MVKIRAVVWASIIAEEREEKKQKETWRNCFEIDKMRYQIKKSQGASIHEAFVRCIDNFLVVPCYGRLVFLLNRHGVTSSF